MWYSQDRVPAILHSIGQYRPVGVGVWEAGNLPPLPPPQVLPDEIPVMKGMDRYVVIFHT